VFRVEDLDDARATLESRGAEFEEHVGEVEGFARFASFRDPDGNVVQIIEYVGERD
jgi:predicted enzyme related to lactoylglutathione lyase